jgi:ABC-type multidrug transport system fused ATPase/permease subunit
MTALVGSSGCGKSTVMNLICGFYHADSGRIKLFDRDIEQWSMEGIRKNLALVTQDSYLFPDTVEENIRYGRQNATLEEIIVAAEAANAHDFILEMPDGYKTLVGERGVKLSGGQRQRISIARAILKDAPILLLDEPTSALDTQSEALVQESIENFTKGKTVLVIAHRYSTIKQADNLLVLDEGKIAESGTHDQLIEKGGLYKQLYLKQFISDEAEQVESTGEGA